MAFAVAAGGVLVMVIVVVAGALLYTVTFKITKWPIVGTAKNGEGSPLDFVVVEMMSWARTFALTALANGENHS